MYLLFVEMSFHVFSLNDDDRLELQLQTDMFYRLYAKLCLNVAENDRRIKFVGKYSLTQFQVSFDYEDLAKINQLTKTETNDSISYENENIAILVLKNEIVERNDEILQGWELLEPKLQLELHLLNLQYELTNLSDFHLLKAMWKYNLVTTKGVPEEYISHGLVELVREDGNSALYKAMDYFWVIPKEVSPYGPFEILTKRISEFQREEEELERILRDIEGY